MFCGYLAESVEVRDRESEEERGNEFIELNEETRLIRDLGL